MIPKNKKLPKKPSGPTKLTPKGKGPNAKGNDKKPAGKKGGGGFFGGRGGYKGVKKSDAKRLVNGVMREELSDLRSQGRTVKRDARSGIKVARTDYNRGKEDLRVVHGEVGDYLSSLAQRNAATVGNEQTQQAQAQAALQTMLGNTYSGAQSQAQSELGRLGIQGGGSFQQLGLDQANAQGVAAQSGANAQSTLGMAGSNSAAAMQMLQGMNQGSYMQGVGQNLNSRNDALAELRNNRTDQLNEVRNAMQEARGTRRDMYFQLLQQLQQTGWDQYVQQQQLQMQRKALNKK